MAQTPQTQLQIVLISLSLITTTFVSGSFSAGFSVKYKFAGREPSLRDLKAHDSRRQLRILAGIDLPLGGNGRRDGLGLYYAKIGIGTPSKDYYLQVDTGSDLTYINCIDCKDCPRKSSLGIDLTLYDVKNSKSGKSISCDQDVCLELSGGSSPGCTGSNETCQYFQIYADGSTTSGYYVKDIVQYDRVSGDLQTKSENETVIFGCGANQSGNLGSSSEEPLDGVLGFGKSNFSMISQLASSRMVKKIFSHCLDGENGGGIFAIGHVVQPKVKTTPLLQNQPHYNVNLTAVQVGHDFLNLPTDVYEAGDRKGAIIDSGTTLAYLPDILYKTLIEKIFDRQPDLRIETVKDDYICFRYSGSVDDGFPTVTFHFENSLRLKVYPRQYLFPFDGTYCIGWQNSGNRSRDTHNLLLLGDLALSNKLVMYDLENQVIGWTEYNCSSSITVKDEQTGTVHLVGPHYISSSCRMEIQGAMVLLLLSMLFLKSYY